MKVKHYTVDGVNHTELRDFLPGFSGTYLALSGPESFEEQTAALLKRVEIERERSEESKKIKEASDAAKWEDLDLPSKAPVTPSKRPGECN